MLFLKFLEEKKQKKKTKKQQKKKKHKKKKQQQNFIHLPLHAPFKTYELPLFSVER